MDSLSEANSSFTHEELLTITSSVLTELLSKDSYLSDLPGDVTLDEVNNQIALLHGKSITINVVRGDQTLPVIVPQCGCRVADLKRAIKRSINLQLSRSKAHSKRKISWRYVWKTYSLEHDGVVMEDDNMKLEDAAVHHKSLIYFFKKRRRKNVYM